MRIIPQKHVLKHILSSQFNFFLGRLDEICHLLFTAHSHQGENAFGSLVHHSAEFQAHVSENTTTKANQGDL